MDNNTWINCIEISLDNYIFYFIFVVILFCLEQFILFSKSFMNWLKIKWKISYNQSILELIIN